MKRFFCYCILLIFLCFLVACNRGIPVTNQMENIYEEAKSYYPDFETRFLPDLKSGRVIYFGVSNTAEGLNIPRYIHIIMKLPKDELEKIQMEAYGTSITRSFNDSNLLIIDYDSEMITHFRNLKPSKELDIFPIPNFDFIQESMFSSSYIDKATIYSLGHSRGLIIEEKYLRKDGAGLPEKWKHGMSKGVVIWDNYVAYFLDVW